MTTSNITISPVNIAERKALKFTSGDTVKVFVKVEEKGKTRLQAFEGTVLARKGGTEAGATFTVRRVAGGYGVEKIFPLFSPRIDRIEIVRHVRTRRSKLYNIRDIATRQIRRQMRKIYAIKESPVTEDEDISKVVSVSAVEETPADEASIESEVSALEDSTLEPSSQEEGEQTPEASPEEVK